MILNSLSVLHLRAKNENTYYTLIKDDVNYEEYFRQGKSLKELYDIFFMGIKFDDGSYLKLPLEDIVGFYLLNKINKNLSSKDIEFLKSVGQFNDNIIMYNFIDTCRNLVHSKKTHMAKREKMLEDYLNTLETYTPSTYELTENNEEKVYNLFIAERRVNSGDALVIFNTLEPHVRFPVIFYSNSMNKIVGKFSNHYTVDFDSSFINKLELEENCIALVNKSGDMTIFNFNEGTCLISINVKKINDDKVDKICNFMKMLTLKEDLKYKSVSGKIVFNVINTVPIYGIYEYFIVNEIAQKLFFIDESARAWCSKDTFNIFFTDFSREFFYSEYVSNDSYFKISIPNEITTNITGFTISFSAKTKDMLPSFLYKFSRLLSNFLNDNQERQKLDLSKLYIKPITALKEKTFRSKMFGQSGNYGDYYSRRCPIDKQPIIIEEDEKDEWEASDRILLKFPPEDWQSKKSYLFVCPRDENPIPEPLESNQNNEEYNDKIIQLPCCQKTFKNKHSQSVSKISNRKAITDQINTLCVIGDLPDSLNSFLSVCYDKDASYKFSKEGTGHKNIVPYNSLIVALIIATQRDFLKSGKANLGDNPLENESIIKEVRSQMSQLPPDIYKQELYDMTNEEIIQSILDPKTFIDPYLYYRGLEIIFDIQIFVFTSDIGRKHPISDKENSLTIPTLEVPRCKYMHVRHNNNKPIVCVYKNYGTKNRKVDIPYCELIICNNESNQVYTKKVNNNNKLFFDRMFNLLYKSNHPFEWERDVNIPLSENCYEDPYSTINWYNYDFDNLGKILGQEIDVEGKCSALLFKEWTLIVPPTQPLFIKETRINSRGHTVYAFKETRIKKLNENGDIEYIHHSHLSGGIKKRAHLKTIDEAMKNFDFSEIDDDGIWLELNGKKKSVKVPCLPTYKHVQKSINSTLRLIQDKNKVSILLQIINWLWRSDWDGHIFPIFEDWWKEKALIEPSIIFTQVPMPKVNCNNMMLPELDTFNQRMEAMVKIWPFFFYRKRIHVSHELYLRIQNNFIIEDVYSRGLTPDDIYAEKPKFITSLIPTDSDFTTGDSIILTKKEHMAEWFNKNSSYVSKFKSLHNCLVIRNNITHNLKNKLEQYLYRETIGDNQGQIYIIQNSSVRSKPLYLSVLHIAHYWSVHESNPGHAYKKNDDCEAVSHFNFVMYKVGADSILEVFKDESHSSTNYLQILCYDNNETYGAMLPLLKKN